MKDKVNYLNKLANKIIFQILSNHSELQDGTDY